MLIAQKYYKEFIDHLNKHEVQYILVGGVAVHAHGYERYTGDVDLWVNPTGDNMSKLMNAIRDFGFDTSKIEKHHFSEKDSPIKLVQEGQKIDIIHHLTYVVSFDEAWQNASKEISGDFHFYLINYQHLLKIKLAAGRPKDLADIDELKKFKEVASNLQQRPRKLTFLQKLFSKKK